MSTPNATIRPKILGDAWTKPAAVAYNWLKRLIRAGFPMRYSLLTSVAFAALIVAAPASFAFQIQPTNNNAGPGANIANNPDSQSDGMSANLSGNNGGNSPVLHFGNSSLSINGGNSGSGNYGMSPAYREQFMGGPGQIGNAISPR